jgi:HEAT repeat protein
MGALDAAVLRAALDDPHPVVRRRACVLGGRGLATGETGVGETGVGETGAGAGLVEALVHTVSTDPDATVVESAAWALGEAGSHGGRRAADALSKVVTAHRDPLCREAAVAALGAIGEPASLDVVLVALGDKAAVRRRAAIALAAFDDPRVDDALRRCLDDRDWQVRQAAEDLLIRP